MSSTAVSPKLSTELLLRKPRDRDGMALNRLIEACPPLDPNSVYCNLLQCSHFAQTSAIAELEGRIMASAVAYPIPDKPSTLFVWQIAVHPDARGRGLAIKLLNEILRRPECAHFTAVETTITTCNQASWQVFRKLAKSLDAAFCYADHFSRDTHFDGQHASEQLITIGPIRRTAKTTFLSH